MSHDELVELTGFKQTKGHIRWLQCNGWRFNARPRERLSA